MASGTDIVEVNPDSGFLKFVNQFFTTASVNNNDKCSVLQWCPCLMA